MIKRKLFFFIIMAFLLNSCENLNDPGELKYGDSVLFNLKVGNTEQEFYVFKAFPLNQPVNDPYGDYTEFLDQDAKVKISTGNFEYNNFGIVDNGKTNNSKKFTNLSELIIKPNSEYNMVITTETDVITGNMTTLGDFEIIKHDTSYHKEDSSLVKLEWIKCNNARFYTVKYKFYKLDSVKVGDYIHYSTGRFFTLWIDASEENTDFYTRELKNPSSFDSLYINVTAYDENYYRFYFENIQQVNINNSTGYFGSSNTKEITIK